MRKCFPVLSAATVVLLMSIPACGKNRQVTTSHTVQGTPDRATVQGPSQAGVPVTKEVPSTRETVGEIRERESIVPPVLGGDIAIPSHGIPRKGDRSPSQAPSADNAAVDAGTQGRSVPTSDPGTR